MFLESAYFYACLVVTLEHNEVVGLLSILIFNLGYEYSDLHANMLKSLEKERKKSTSSSSAQKSEIKRECYCTEHVETVF